MHVHSDLSRAVAAEGSPTAGASLGPATNRALHSRLAWELGVPMGAVENVADYRLVFRSAREELVGRVCTLRGHARTRETLGRVGSFWVYWRDGITLPHGERRLEASGPPFTIDLQGINTRRSTVGNSPAG